MENPNNTQEDSYLLNLFVFAISICIVLSLRVNLGSMPISRMILRKRGTKGGLIGTIQS